jgi:hypothetical protein
VTASSEAGSRVVFLLIPFMCFQDLGLGRVLGGIALGISITDTTDVNDAIR